MRASIFGLILCLIAWPTVGHSQTFKGNRDSITFFGSFPGFTSSYALGISGDGSTIIGDNLVGGTQIGWKWTAAGGFVRLSGLAEPEGISYNGSVIVGQASTSGGVIITPTGMVALPGISSFSVSEDGKVVAGEYGGVFNQAGFVWTSQTGMVTMGGPYGGNCSPHAMNSDGSIVVGQAFDPTLPQTYGFKWTASTGAISLLNGVYNGVDASANAVSDDGSVVGGSADLNGNYTAAIWTPAKGWQTVYPTDTHSDIIGLTPDGRFAVGNNDDLNKPFMWDSVNGLRYVQDVLTADGVNLTGYQLKSVGGISADGSTLTGTATNSSGASVPWIATLPVPEPTSCSVGLISAGVLFRRRKK